MGYIDTKHLEQRLRQRGVKGEAYSTILQWADVEVPVGGGDVSLTLSKDAIEELAVEGVPMACRDKLKRLAVVVTTDGVVKTCLVIRKSGRNWRRYRRGV